MGVGREHSSGPERAPATDLHVGVAGLVAHGGPMLCDPRRGRHDARRAAPHGHADGAGAARPAGDACEEQLCGGM